MAGENLTSSAPLEESDEAWFGFNQSSFGGFLSSIGLTAPHLRGASGKEATSQGAAPSFQILSVMKTSDR